MPIYHKAPPSTASSHTTADIDYHTSEAAKVKRTREQAYFNSYDFDAIEVLPYEEEDDDDDDHDHGGGKGLRGKLGKPANSQNHVKPKAFSQQQQQSNKKSLSTPFSFSAKKVHNHSPIDVNRSQHVSKHLDGNISSNITTSTRKYLQRFGVAIFGGNHHNTANISKKPPIQSHLHHHHLSLASSSLTSSSASASASASGLSSTLTATSRILHDDTTTATNITHHHLNGAPSPYLRSSSASSSGSISSSILVNADSLGHTHRHSIDDSGHVSAMGTTMAGSTVAATSTATPTPLPSPSTAAKTTTSAGAAAATSDGNFLLPRVMLKYQSTPIASNSSNISSSSCCNNQLATAANTSMSLAAAQHNGAASSAATSAAAALTTAAAAANVSNSISNKVAASKISTDVYPATSATIMLQGPSTNSNSNNKHHHGLKKHSTASSSLSSLASDEIVEIHHHHQQHAEARQNGAHPSSNSQMLSRTGRTKLPGRAGSHQSHYSTDKSASSGYYSSNMCSTYSLEEHIYSEPTMVIKEKPALALKQKESAAGDVTTPQNATPAVAMKNNSIGNTNNNHINHSNIATNKPVQESGGHNNNNTNNYNNHATLSIGQTATAISVMRTLDYNRRHRYTDPAQASSDAPTATLPPLTLPVASPDFSEKLRILESSIENLDRHLKTFPGLASQDAIVPYAAPSAYNGNSSALHPEKSRSYAHLPTIKEGLDVVTKVREWPEEPLTDDSLLDIDLDSFLLDDRKKNAKTAGHSGPVNRKGIDNPSFLIGEQEENHYKCAKYINSCPEDAYRVESDIIAPTRSSISEQSVAVSVDLYPKRYEDQLHFQSTRELLEDVRDKIRLLTRTQDAPDLQLTKVGAAKQHHNALEEYIPKELNSMISTLKRELELYLERMNRHSELEIRQLCTGLVNNQNIVKMKNAFERRRSLTDSMEHIATYEAVQAGEMRAVSGVGGGSGLPISIRQQHITTIKCSSDPNFKMKRKSLTEVFPLTECYIETSQLPPAALPHPIGSQLQRNLNFHQPQLKHFDKDNLDKAKENTGNGGSASGSGSATVNGSGSGGETSESNDKDSILDWHRKKPSIWEMYYGTNRIQQSLLGANSSSKKNKHMVPSTPSPMCYPSSRPESDFTLDLPRAEQLRIKMEKEKKFRQRCRVITSFLSLIFFLLTVMVVSLVLTRGKRMFGSMI